MMSQVTISWDCMKFGPSKENNNKATNNTLNIPKDSQADIDEPGKG